MPEQELIAALSAAGAIDTDLWKLARTDLPATVAVADLQHRYPGAFEPVEPPFNARTATKAEVDRRWREMQAQEYQRSVDAVHAHNMRDMERRFGVKK